MCHWIELFQQRLDVGGLNDMRKFNDKVSFRFDDGLKTSPPAKERITVIGAGHYESHYETPRETPVAAIIFEDSALTQHRKTISYVRHDA
jgi:hypothetical protein